MLDMGFIEDIDYIMKQIPNGSQTALFSATMPNEILRLSRKYMNNPVNVLIDSDELSLEGIDQSYAVVDERTKFPALVEYIRKNADNFWNHILRDENQDTENRRETSGSGLSRSSNPWRSIPEQERACNAKLQRRPC